MSMKPACPRTGATSHLLRSCRRSATTGCLNRSSAVLSVPSAVTPEERNYLINPEHEHFRSVDVGSSRPFQIDLRLLT